MSVDTMGALFSDCQQAPQTGPLKVVEDVRLGLRSIQFQYPESCGHDAQS